MVCTARIRNDMGGRFGRLLPVKAPLLRWSDPMQMGGQVQDTMQ